MKRIFFSKLKIFFKARHLDFRPQRDKLFFNFLYENTLGKSLSFSLIRQTIKEYQKISGKRFSLRKDKTVKQVKPVVSPNLIQMIGRKHSPIFKITSPDGKHSRKILKLS